MGEGTTDVKAKTTTENLEGEVSSIRDDIGEIAGELNRRGRELTDWRHQLREHGPAIALTVGGLIAFFVARGALGAWRKRRYDRPLAKIRRVREAVSRIVEHPERVAQPQPSAVNKIFTAALSSLAGTIASRLSQQILASSAEPDAAP